MTPSTTAKPGALHKIVIVGGGAGGLELATRLGKTLGRRKQAMITLVDRSRTHLWKPLLHQVAAGSMDLNDHELDYLYQARWHYFGFRLGNMIGLDRGQREIHLAPVFDDGGREVIPARAVPYDTLVQVMDALRSFESRQAGQFVQAELFPDISIGDAPLLGAAAATGG